eukprot:1638843-Pleurochrysis_carterae.AAC.1
MSRIAPHTCTSTVRFASQTPLRQAPAWARARVAQRGIHSRQRVLMACSPISRGLGRDTTLY